MSESTKNYEKRYRTRRWPRRPQHPNLTILAGFARASSKRDTPDTPGPIGQNRFEGENGQRQNDHQGKHGIARMTQAQGSLCEVIDDRKNYWVSADRNEQGTAKNPQASKRSDDSHKHEDIPGKNECHERGACQEKITLRRFGAKPCGDNSPTEELHRQAGMRADELPGVLPFFIEECGLAKLGVAADLFESGDAIHRAGMLVVDLVVAHPEFEWKIGT
jgi:hypothetical protein